MVVSPQVVGAVERVRMRFRAGDPKRTTASSTNLGIINSGGASTPTNAKGVKWLSTLQGNGFAFADHLPCFQGFSQILAASAILIGCAKSCGASWTFLSTRSTFPRVRRELRQVNTYSVLPAVLEVFASLATTFLKQFRGIMLNSKLVPQPPSKMHLTCLTI